MEPAAKMPAAIFVAKPPFRSPTLGVSPEDFKEHGYGKDIDGNKAFRGNIRFDEAGRYEAYDDVMVDLLRKHSGNVANGGGTFFEIPNEALRHGRAIEGSVTASMPEEGMSENDQKLVNSLVKIGKSPNMTGALAAMKGAVERFRIAGFEMPSAERKRPIIRGRLFELLETLEEQGIKPD